MLGNLARPVWGWGLGAIPGPTPLFVGSKPAGHRAATLMSMIATCKANLVEPWAWLKDVLTQLPLGTPLESLLPNIWLASHPEHRWSIAERRKLERERYSDT